MFLYFLAIASQDPDLVLVSVREKLNAFVKESEKGRGNENAREKETEIESETGDVGRRPRPHTTGNILNTLNINIDSL